MRPKKYPERCMRKDQLLCNAYEEACQGCESFSASGQDHFRIDGFTETLKLRLTSKDDDASSRILDTVSILLENSYASEPRKEVLEVAIMGAFPEILNSASNGSHSKTALRELLSYSAALCHPRDILTTYMGHMRRSCPLTCFCNLLLEVLPIALSRVRRNQLQLLQNILHEAYQHYHASFAPLLSPESALEGQACQPQETKILRAFVEFQRDIRYYMSRWEDPAPWRQGLKIAAAHLLKFIAEMKLDRLPIPICLHQLHESARLHFQPDSRTGERDLALCNTALESLDALLMFDLVDLLQVVSPAHAEVENRHLQDCDVEAGKGIALTWILCCPSLDCYRPSISEEAKLLSWALKHVVMLMQRASVYQNAIMAQKALALLVACCIRIADKEGKLTEVQSYQPLIQTLATTMNYNPIQKLRNASTHALMVLLNSFQVEALLEALEFIHSLGMPAVSAHGLQFLTKLAAQCWPSTGTTGSLPDDDTKREVLMTRLLPTVLAWFRKAGRYRPKDSSSLRQGSEAVSAALNLYRFMLLRERQDGTRLTPVGQPAAVQGILQEGIMPLMCLTRDTLNQKSDSIPEVALQETLGLQRLLEVLTRIQEISTD